MRRLKGRRRIELQQRRRSVPWIARFVVETLQQAEHVTQAEDRAPPANAVSAVTPRGSVPSVAVASAGARSPVTAAFDDAGARHTGSPQSGLAPPPRGFGESSAGNRARRKSIRKGHGRADSHQ